VGEADVELIRRIYGFDWAGIGSRSKGFSELAGLITTDFQSRFSPELGERVVEGVDGLSRFTQALEEDFCEFRYEADELIDAPEGTVVVLGTIHARGRHSQMPLGGDFGHVWSLRDGKAAAVAAYRDRDSARREAGLS
jgi:ketosteroid isomerase-like protein